EAKVWSGGTATERVNLGYHLIRRGQYDKALGELLPADRQERANFMLQANLATAYQHIGQLEQAKGYLLQALGVWPKEWPGLTPEQLTWYHKMERLHLKLVRLRYQETLRQPGGKAKPPESV